MRRFGPPIQPYITPRGTEPYAEEEEELGSFKRQELYEKERPVIKKEILEHSSSESD